MQVLNLATKEKQDQILSNFPLNGGTIFSKYTPYMAFAQTTSQNQWVTVADVVGEGFVKLQISSVSSTDVRGSLIITIDGVVFQQLTNVPSLFKGAGTGSSGSIYGTTSMNASELPINSWGSSGSSGTIIDPFPLHFKKSFKFQILTPETTNVRGLAVLMV